jgi:hypothetical protein
VKELGLEPFAPAPPLPPIEEDEIRLICWLSLETGRQNERDEREPGLRVE